MKSIVGGNFAKAGKLYLMTDHVSLFIRTIQASRHPDCFSEPLLSSPENFLCIQTFQIFNKKRFDK